jgi:prepilin-type N-terminal cleavage/methylation domain-containing protein
MKKRHAFTLIELLVVIAIIGIVAALVVNMNSGAQTAKRNTAVNGDKASLTLIISDYQAKLNFYPPDNGRLATAGAAGPGSYYDAVASTNPLLYELTGATNLNNNGMNTIQFFDGTSNTAQNIYNNLFTRPGVQNANPDEPHDFFSSGPQPKEYANYTAGINLYGLIVPVPLRTTPFTNFWHYDSSSTNRHNLQSYDLWAEYISANKNGSNIITTNGNW